MLLCRGQGLEPHVEFERNLVEFGPILPHSNGDEQDIIVRNPCSFPIEIYNLEFDKSYLDEEKVNNFFSKVNIVFGLWNIIWGMTQGHN